MELEDLQSQSIASINGMACEQAQQQQQELQAARRAQGEAEKKIEARTSFTMSYGYILLWDTMV